ncbi:hypothetical protein LLE49_26795 [Alicyclobacillus tolerans]|nr:hypothetical protein [Alicyclobacillus tolerans]MCF8568334.1 hypothetical protein [Alicyclobacillus tolerans]
MFSWMSSTPQPRRHGISPPLDGTAGVHPDDMAVTEQRLEVWAIISAGSD